MAEQIKYISENGRVYINEIQPIVDSFYSKLTQMGAENVNAHFVEAPGFEFNHTYEFPRQGSVFLHLKEYATIPGHQDYPESLNYNVLVNLLGFREDTKNYQKIKSSIEDILLTEAFDKKE